MAITYTYPSGTLTIDDYLIGTDRSKENATNSFKVSDVISAILAALNIGTVESINGSNSTYISISGGPITTTGTLTTSLSATGTPSADTFLRGDGTWSLPGPTPTDITTAYNGLGNTLTTDTASWKFTGDGVTAYNSNDNVTVDIPGVISVVDSIISGVGITSSGTTTTNPSTGDVTITNNVYQARAGGNVTLSGSASPLQYSSAVTINTTANPGTVTSVNAATGIEVSNASTNPNLSVDLTGSNNYIRTQNTATVTEDDLLPYNQLTTSDVKTSRFGNLTADMLLAIKNYINTGDENKISNVESPNYTTTAKAMQMVTLTITEYNQLTPKDPNTIYLILGAGTSHTVSLNRIVNITDTSTGGPASPSNYDISTTINSAPGTSVSGVNGTPYTFVTTFTPLNGYTSSGATFSPSATITGTINGSATINQTITASITPPVSSCSLSLNIDTSGINGPSAGYSLAPGYPSPSSPQTTACGGNVNYSVLYNVNNGYSGSFEYSSNGINWQASGSFTFSNNNGTVIIYVRGTITATLYSATLSVSSGNNLTVTGSGGTLSGASISYSASSTPPQAGYGMSIPALIAAGGSYGWDNFTASISGTNYSEDPASPISYSSDLAGTTPITSLSNTIPGGGGNQTETIYAQGTIIYAPPPATNEVKMEWLDYQASSPHLQSKITDSTGLGYTLVPLEGATSGQVAPGYPYLLNSGTNPSITLAANQRWSTGVAPTLTQTNQTMSGTMPTSPAPAFSTWEVASAQIINYVEVTIKVTYQLVYPASNAAYGVTFTGATSQTFNVSGNGNTSQGSFQVNANGKVDFMLERTSGSWCTNDSSYTACQLTTNPQCYPTYTRLCSQYVPEGNNISNYWEGLINGTSSGHYGAITKGVSQIYGITGTFSNGGLPLTHGQTVEIYIKEI